MIHFCQSSVNNSDKLYLLTAIRSIGCLLSFLFIIFSQELPYYFFSINFNRKIYNTENCLKNVYIYIVLYNILWFGHFFLAY